MAWVVKEASPADERFKIQIQSAAHPEYVPDATALQWFPASQFDAPHGASTGLIAIADEVPLGYATLWRFAGRRYRLDLLVHPNHRRAGVGIVLFAWAAKVAQWLGARTVQARVRSDATSNLEFAQHRGFSATQEMVGYELDVRNSDRSSRPISPAIPDGFSVVTLSGAQAGNTRWKEQLLSLLWPTGQILIQIQQALLPFQ